MMGELDILKILKNHLVRTGFMEHYNNLVDVVIYDVQNDGNGNLVFYTNVKTITIPFASNLGDLGDVDSSNSTSGDVLVFNGSNWTNQPFEYIRPNFSTRPELSDVGEITSIHMALDKILYPFVNPSFTSLSIQGVSSILELGDCISTSSGGVNTFQWGMSTINNISDTDGYTITDLTASTTLDTNILPKTTTTKAINIPYGICKTTNGATHSFRIQGKNTQNQFFSINVTYTWRPRIFWGTNPNAIVLSDNEINGLSASNTGGTKLATSLAQTFLMDGNGEYIWIVIPQSFGLAINPNGTQSKFIVGGLANSSWEVFSTTFTNTFGHSELYYLYRSSTIQFGIGIDIKIVP
jgi:hypothetical protein